MQKEPLNGLHKILLGIHAAFAVVFAVIGFVSSSGAEGWADLALVATAALAGAYLVGVSITFLIARFLIGSDVGRLVAVVAGPPLMLVLAILFLRAS
jgi:hypothetical protein